MNKINTISVSEFISRIELFKKLLKLILIKSLPLLIVMFTPFSRMEGGEKEVFYPTRPKLEEFGRKSGKLPSPILVPRAPRFFFNCVSCSSGNGNKFEFFDWPLKSECATRYNILPFYAYRFSSG